ncbi:hypothetical protein GRM42_004636 [Salmonella enterica]|nr:hypothetical protein [Salmonella enterica]ECP3221909.1 hypothetical protein [Salmonella enterica]EDC1722194.1 hypothetical protein [Salmonella enterica subsp. enterica serovar Rissen]EDJ4601780.1 hypothetical protein [Salmonella enterica]EEJ5618722.1 hypothetical protein [Salmonella enterica]
MTSSGQSHQLRTGTVLKPDLTSRVFLRLVIQVITVRYVNSEILREGLGARIYERAPGNAGINKPSPVKGTPDSARTRAMILTFIVASQFKHNIHAVPELLH